MPSRITFLKQSHILWLKHLQQEFVAELKRRCSGKQIRLWINDQPTTWEWAKNSADGLKVIQGEVFWNLVESDQSVEVSLDVPDDPARLIMPGAGATLLQRKTGRHLFDRYIVADYSGASSEILQRRSICIADATADGPIARVAGKFTRVSLLAFFLRTLRSATDQGCRCLIGCDHQYGLPLGFAELLGLETQDWRTLLHQLVIGANGVPSLEHPKFYCRKVNRWLVARGHLPYFYTATKASQYSDKQYIDGTECLIVPATDPRGDRPESERNRLVRRLTEQFWALSGQPKFFNRVGDNGTVGGQSILGLKKLYEVLALTADSIPLAVWPFDGPDLDSSAYEGRHVLVEPYPSGVRPSDVKQTDWDDAKSCVQALRDADGNGQLAGLLSFRSVCGECIRRVRMEGWIALNSVQSLNSPADACRFCGNSLNS